MPSRSDHETGIRLDISMAILAIVHQLVYE